MRFQGAPALRLILLVGVLFFLTQKVRSEVVKDETKETSINDRWKKLDKNSGKLVGSAIKMILPQVLEKTSQVNLSSECVKQGMHLISGLRRLRLWAVSFIDSSTKMVDGILSGSISFPGVYQECVGIKVPLKNSDEPMFRGQYCQVKILPPMPPKTKIYKYDEPLDELKNFTGSEVMNLLAKKSGILYSYPYQIGVCVPSGCSVDDLSQIADLVSKEVDLMISVESCEVEQEPHYTVGVILGIVFLCYMSLLVLLATAYDWYLTHNDIKNKNYWIQIFLCYSMITNFKKLFGTKTSEKSLKSLHGIKFLSITMVVMGHSYLYPYFILRAYQTLFDVNEEMKKPMSYMIMNSHVVVDTFFCVTGLLVCYITMKATKIDKKRFNVTFFIFHRLWRLAPVYYLILIVTQTVSLMGSGPFFKDAMDISINNCANYWWRNVLFINNFFKYYEICLVHTWYVSVDFQLYLCSLLVLLPLLRSQKLGVTINILIIIISVVYTGLMIYIFDLPRGASIKNVEKEVFDDTYIYVYGNALTHAGPYFVGFLVGYLLAMQPDVKIPQKYQVLGWLTAAFCAWYTMFYNSIRQYYDEPYEWELTVYAALYRTTWAAAVGWMTFCCCTGRGGPINAFLSWTPWVPLAKLTFLIYLIQPTLQTMFIGVFKSPHEYTHFELVTIYFGLLVMASLLAVGGNLLIESPLMAIEKILLGPPRVKTVVFVETNNEKSLNGLNKTDPVAELNDFKDNKYDYSRENKAYDEV